MKDSIKFLARHILQALRWSYKPVASAIVYKRFAQEFRQFQQMADKEYLSPNVKWKERYPILNEKTEITSFEPHYIFHPAWAARILKLTHPKKHIDISSSLSFVTLVSAFIPVDFYDYRPAKFSLSGLQCGKSDLTKLPFETESVSSLSCMHVIEHIGLGRYGDALDPLGDLKAIKELQRVVTLGGNLLMVVPVGRARIQFNAHRVYDPDNFLKLFHNWMLVDFSLVDDEGKYWEQASVAQAKELSYGCGCFWLQKQ